MLHMQMSVNLTSNVKIFIPSFTYLVFIHNSQSDGTINWSGEVWQAVQMWNKRQSPIKFQSLSKLPNVARISSSYVHGSLKMTCYTYVYQGHNSEDSFRLAPVSPEHGMKWMSFFGLKPTFFRNGTNFSLHSSYLWGKCVFIGKGRTRYKDLNDRSQTLFNIPIQTPVHSGIVHFVDEDYQMFDSSCFGQHGMLPCLTSLFKTGLKLTLSGRDDLKKRKTSVCQ